MFVNDDAVAVVNVAVLAVVNDAAVAFISHDSFVNDAAFAHVFHLSMMLHLPMSMLLQLQ